MKKRILRRDHFDITGTVTDTFANGTTSTACVSISRRSAAVGTRWAKNTPVGADPPILERRKEVSGRKFVLPPPKRGLSLALVIVVAAGTATAQAPSVTFTNYPFIAGFYFTGITAGPDGAVWFSGYVYDPHASGPTPRMIGRSTTDGVITQYPISNAPSGIAVGPDGALWFTEDAADKIGRITTDGAVTEYSVPCCGEPSGIAVGSDGALWFTEGNKIGRITTDGVVTEYSLPKAGAGAAGITAGPDGALWFTEPAPVIDAIDLICSGNDTIGRITTTGIITEYDLGTSCRGLMSIASGPDGTLWYNESYWDAIGRITTDGIVTEYTLPSAVEISNDITAGPDGALWFPTFNLADGSGILGRITTAGVITEYVVAPNTFLTRIVTGPDGALWLTLNEGSIVHASLSNSGATQSR